MRLKQSMDYAWQGIRCAWREEQQMKIHLVMAILAVLCGAVIGTTTVTAYIESATGIAEGGEGYCSGAVLVVSLGAVVIGVCLFGTRVIEWIGG